MCNQAIQNQLDGYEDRSISLLDNAKPILAVFPQKQIHEHEEIWSDVGSHCHRLYAPKV